MNILKIVVFLVALGVATEAANILVLILIPSKSHQIW